MSTFLRHLASTLFLAAVAVGLLVPVHAGDGSGDTRFGTEKFGVESIRQLALKLNDELDRRRVNVAILARSGRPRSSLPKGISYTHVAFAMFEPVQEPDGKVFHTYTVYNLYQHEDGQADRSYLKQDYTYDFVAGTAEEDVAVCVPTAELQLRLAQVIRSPTYAMLHTADYNLLANPWVDRFDNCVTHALKVCIAAIYQTDDRAQIYENIRAHFHPTRVRFGPITTLGSHFVKGLRREDMDRRGLQTASYDSLKRFLDENELVHESFVVRMN